LGYRSDPLNIAYNPVNDELYVTALNNLYVINGASDKLLKTIPLAVSDGITVDILKNNVYVVYNNNILVISGRTNTVTATIDTVSIHATLSQLAYDQSNNKLYAVTSDSAFAYAFSTVTNKLVANISIGLSAAQSLIYDSTNKNLYVGFDGYNSIVVISGPSNKLLTTIKNATGTNRHTIAFDEDNGNIYAACCGTLYAISGSTNAVVGL
jgi:DNA-binding beta-propeller fold protein YncE